MPQIRCVQKLTIKALIPLHNPYNTPNKHKTRASQTPTRRLNQQSPSVLVPGFVIDTRDVPTIRRVGPGGTENAKNAGPDPSDGPTPSRHLLGSRTRPAIPWEGSAPTT